jgi:hypothetical protein
MLGRDINKNASDIGKTNPDGIGGQGIEKSSRTRYVRTREWKTLQDAENWNTRKFEVQYIRTRSIGRVGNRKLSRARSMGGEGNGKPSRRESIRWPAGQVVWED